MKVSVEIKGLDQMEAKLSKMEKSVAAKNIKSAQMKATLPTSKKAKSITPVGKYKTPRKDRTSGTLKKSISRKTLKSRKYSGRWSGVRVRFNSKRAFYYRYVTGGTKPHDLNSGSKRARNHIGYKRGSLNKGKSLKRRMHPGVKGRDILGIAFRLTRARMGDIFAKELKRKIDRSVQ